MTNRSDYVPWATGVGANITPTPADYAALTMRQLGVQAGRASSVAFNSAMRQASVVAAMIGKFTADYGPSDVIDDGNVTNFEAQFLAALEQVISTAMAAFSLDQSAYVHYAANDTGVANAYVFNSVSPALANYNAGFVLLAKIAHTNTDASTINLQGMGVTSITRPDMAALEPGDLVANGIAVMVCDGARLQLESMIPPPASTLTTTTIYNNLVTDHPSMLPARNILLNQSAHGSGNVTVPAGVTQIYYEVGGAGGGGAGTNSTVSGLGSGGGGGSGGIAFGWMNVSPGDTISYVCGQGGAGAAPPSNSTTQVTGSTGETSSITHNSTTISATGGEGGLAGNGAAGGGNPGHGSGGQFNEYGAPGGDGNPFNINIQGGAGGASRYGGGGRTSTIGHGVYLYIDGFSPCSGGGGCWGSIGAAEIGGYGADGLIRLMY